MLTFSVVGSLPAVPGIGGLLPGSDSSLAQTDAAPYGPQPFTAPETRRNHPAAVAEGARGSSEVREISRTERQGLSPWRKVRAIAALLFERRSPTR
jgi:hypothetical protein